MLTEDPADADAVLSGTYGDIVVLDSEQSETPQYWYKWRLVSERNERLWKTEFKFRSESGVADADERASIRVAQSVHKAVQAGSKKAHKSTSH